MSAQVVELEGSMTRYVEDTELSEWMRRHSRQCPSCGVLVNFDPVAKRYRDSATDAIHVCAVSPAPAGPAEPGALRAPAGGVKVPDWFRGRRSASSGPRRVRR